MELDIPKAKGLFITGTDTGVGKTLVAGGIAHILSRQGLKVGVFKPVASGCRRQREGLVSGDAEFLALCCNFQFELSLVNPVTFATPAAPVVCEEMENRRVDYEAIATAYRYICNNCDFVIVEGIGGVMVPITEHDTILDLAEAFALPAVVVARPTLGTINHSLMTIACVRAAGLRVAGVVINGYDAAQADIAEETAGRVIGGFGQTNLLSIVPFDGGTDVEAGVLGDLAVEALGDCDWVNLAH